MNKTFNYVQAMRLLLEGKKVRNVDWPKDQHICACGDEIRSEAGDILDADHLIHTEIYELYEEPKPKKVLKPFLVDTSVGKKHHVCHVYYFDSEISAKHHSILWGFTFVGPAKGIPDQEVDA